MKKKIIIWLISLAIACLLIGFTAYILFVPRPDINNTELIEVTFYQENTNYTIEDKQIILKVIRAISRQEYQSFVWDTEEPYSFSLMLYSPTSGYGPILFFEQYGLCQYVDESQGYYVKINGDIFDLIDSIKN